MKQYESFVISQGNVQGLRSSAFGLKSNNDLFDEFKGRGRGREGDLHQMAALQAMGKQESSLCDTEMDLRGVILIWFKANIQILLNLLEKVKMMHVKKKT